MSNFKVALPPVAMEVRMTITGNVFPLGPGDPFDGIRLYESDIDVIRKLRDDLTNVIDRWDAREMKKKERRAVLAALREVQKFEVKA